MWVEGGWKSFVVLAKRLGWQDNCWAGTGGLPAVYFSVLFCFDTTKVNSGNFNCPFLFINAVKMSFEAPEAINCLENLFASLTSPWYDTARFWVAAWWLPMTSLRQIYISFWNFQWFAFWNEGITYSSAELQLHLSEARMNFNPRAAVNPEQIAMFPSYHWFFFFFFISFGGVELNWSFTRSVETASQQWCGITNRSHWTNSLCTF